MAQERLDRTPVHAKFRLGRPRSNVPVRVGPDVGIEPERHPRLSTLTARNAVDRLKLRFGLDIEAKDLLP